MGWSRDLSCHCGRSLPKPQLKLEMAPPPHPPPPQPASLELQMEDHQLEQELLEQELQMEEHQLEQEEGDSRGGNEGPHARSPPQLASLELHRHWHIAAFYRPVADVSGGSHPIVALS